MDTINAALSLFGRLLLVLIFFMSMFNKITNFTGTQGYMESKGMVMTGFFLAGAIVLLLLGSASLIAGFQTKFGVAALMLFLIPATVIFHTDFSEQREIIQFMKNLAIMGGLLTLAANGPGAWSVDAKLAGGKSEHE